MDLDDLLDILKENFGLVFLSLDNFIKYVLALFIGIYLIKPAFQLGFFTGIFFVGTFLWILLFNTIIFIKEYKYAIILFMIVAIRGAIGDVAGQGFLFLSKGDLISGILFLIVWFGIYLKTKEMQEH